MILPVEIWTKIFSHLNATDLGVCLAVNKQWFNILDGSSMLWRRRADMFLTDHQGDRVAGEFRSHAADECLNASTLQKAFQKVKKHQNRLECRLAANDGKIAVSDVFAQTKGLQIYRMNVEATTFDYEKKRVALEVFPESATPSVTFLVLRLKDLKEDGRVGLQYTEMEYRFQDGLSKTAVSLELKGLTGNYLLLVYRSLAANAFSEWMFIWDWQQKRRVATISYGMLNKAPGFLEGHRVRYCKDYITLCLILGTTSLEHVKVWKISEIVKAVDDVSKNKSIDKDALNGEYERAVRQCLKKISPGAGLVKNWNHNGKRMYILTGSPIDELFLYSLHNMDLIWKLQLPRHLGDVWCNAPTVKGSFIPNPVAGGIQLIRWDVDHPSEINENIRGPFSTVGHAIVNQDRVNRWIAQKSALDDNFHIRDSKTDQIVTKRLAWTMGGKPRIYAEDFTFFVINDSGVIESHDYY